MISNIFCLINNDTFNNNNIKNILKEYSITKNNIELKKSVKLILSCQSNIFKKNQKNNCDNNEILEMDDIILLVTGDIYNFSELFKLINVKPKTNHNGEIIIKLYKIYGIEQTINLIDGDFNFVLIDNTLSNHEKCSKLFICRSPFGLKPLYCLKSKIFISQNVNGGIGNYNENFYVYAISSNVEVLKEMTKRENNSNYFLIDEYKPSSFSYFKLELKALAFWNLVSDNEYYYNLKSLNINFFKDTINNEEYINYSNKMINYLHKSLIKRIDYTNTHNVSFLLTSNIPDILIASYFSKNKINIKYFSIGFENSEDTIYIDKIAKYLNLNYEKIKITQETYGIMYEKIKNDNFPINDLKKSAYNFLFANYLKENTDICHLYLGFGGNELFGLNLNINETEKTHKDFLMYDKNIRENIKNIHKNTDYIDIYNCMKIHNINVISPFLDKFFIDFYVSSHLTIKRKDNDILYNFIDYLPVDIVNFCYQKKDI